MKHRWVRMVERERAIRYPNEEIERVQQEYVAGRIDENEFEERVRAILRAGEQ